MSKIALEGNASGTGTFTIAGPNTNTNYTITLPQETGTLVTTGVTTGLNGSAISTGVVAASVGGTGITSAGTAGNVLTSNGTAWLSQAAAAGGGDYIMNAYTSPATWTKPAGLKAVKVTVVGGGGSGGTGGPSGSGCSGPGGNGGNGGGALKYIDAPAIPGPVSVTVGTAANTSSFGPLVSATGGSNGGPGPTTATGTHGAGGAGSNGTVDLSGQPGAITSGTPASITFAGSFGFGGYHNTQPVNSSPPSKAGFLYGGGATGGVAPAGGPPSNQPGGTGAAGIVIVEEFY
jgi:hypothetical protein